MHVALQPSGNASSRKHYQDTIERPVPLATLAKFLGPQVTARLREIYGHNPVPTWGVTPGKGGVNKGKWDRLGPGDSVLFAAESRIKASAVVTVKAHDARLARELWGEQEDGQTWEFLYFLTDVTGHNIPVSEIQSLAGYKDGFRIQGFNVLDAEKSARIRAAFELDGSMSLDEGESDELASESSPGDATIEGELDAEGKSRRRKEQGKIKRLLMGSRKTGQCAICGREVPTPLLIGAHVKKRACCTDSEKRDLANIAVLMCKFGCDDLYEKGYITVRDGVVEISPLLVRTPPVDDLVRLIEGRRLPAHRQANSNYFAWHNDNVFKAAPRLN